MKPSAHWVPAVFCAFLSLIAFSGLISTEAGLKLSNWWAPAFFAFLPFCFYLVGAVMGQSRREIQDLRQQIIDLKQMPGH